MKIVLAVVVALLVAPMLVVIIQASQEKPYILDGDFVLYIFLPVALIIFCTGVVTSIYAYRTQNSKRAIRIFLVVTALSVLPALIYTYIGASFALSYQF